METLAQANFEDGKPGINCTLRNGNNNLIA